MLLDPDTRSPAMESVFVSFLFFTVATLVYALRTVSRPAAPAQLPADVGAATAETTHASRSKPDEDADPVGRVLDIA
jgi:hypothetical protein